DLGFNRYSKRCCFTRGIKSFTRSNCQFTRISTNNTTKLFANTETSEGNGKCEETIDSSWCWSTICERVRLFKTICRKNRLSYYEYATRSRNNSRRPSTIPRDGWHARNIYVEYGYN